jgi:hypothetical protein
MKMLTRERVVPTISARASSITPREGALQVDSSLLNVVLHD